MTSMRLEHKRVYDRDGAAFWARKMHEMKCCHHATQDFRVEQIGTCGRDLTHRAVSLDHEPSLNLAPQLRISPEPRLVARREFRIVAANDRLDQLWW